MKKENKIADSVTGPYAGSGKLSDYKKDGSWIMNQIEKGYDKCDRGISIDKSDADHMRFAKKHERIAKSLVASEYSFRIEKTYRQLSSSSRNNYRYALRWAIYGDFDGVSLNELNIMCDVIMAKSGYDQNKIVPSFNAVIEYLGEPTIDFGKSCIKVDAIAALECNIVTDVQQIEEFLSKIGFDKNASDVPERQEDNDNEVKLD